MRLLQDSQRAAAPASLEIVEIRSKFRPEVLPHFAGAEFDKSGSRRCEFSGRACGQPIALLRFRRKSKHFIQPFARQPRDRPQRETCLQIRNSDHTLAFLERGKDFPSQTKRDISGVQKNKGSWRREFVNFETVHLEEYAGRIPIRDPGFACTCFENPLCSLNRVAAIDHIETEKLPR